MARTDKETRRPKPVVAPSAAPVEPVEIVHVASIPPAPRVQAEAAKPAASTAPADATPAMPDFEELSRNLSRLVEEGGKVVSAYVAPRDGDTKSALSDEVADAVRTLGKVAEHWLSDPQRAMAAQAAISTRFIDLWGMTLRRMTGETAEPVAPTAPGDKRFADKEWQANPVFDFVRQAYTLTSEWAGDLAARADTLDPHTRAKAEFYVRQLSGALSPSNFLVTNPELLRETLKENGGNLVRGLAMMAEDIEAGHGTLKIRQSDPRKFELGVNVATTPGKVVFRNDLIELLQYAPTTERVLRRPLLIVPPWINKFYVLDLNPQRIDASFAGLVAQGTDAVRRSPGSTRTSSTRTRISRATCAKASSPRSKPSNRRPESAHRPPSDIAWEAPCSPSRSPGWRRRATTGSRPRPS